MDHAVRDGRPGLVKLASPNLVPMVRTAIMHRPDDADTGSAKVFDKLVIARVEFFHLLRLGRTEQMLRPAYMNDIDVSRHRGHVHSRVLRPELFHDITRRHGTEQRAHVIVVGRGHIPHANLGRELEGNADFAGRLELDLV